MKGHIRKRGSSYQVIISVTDPTGKRRQKSKSFKGKREAEKALAEMIVQAEKGNFFDDSNLSLEEYLLKWLDTYAKHQVEETTYVFYADIINRILIPNLGSIKLSKLKSLSIQEFFNSLLEKNEELKKENKNLSSYTLRHYYNTLNIALNQAVAWDIIEKNPCKAVEPPAIEEREYNVWSVEEIHAVLNYTKDSDFKVMYLPLVLSLYGGLRRGEVLGLWWQDIDWNNNCVHIKRNLVMVGKDIRIGTPKTKKSMRTVTLPKEVMELLYAHRKQQLDYAKLFGDEYHGPNFYKDYFGPEYEDANFVCTWTDGKFIRPDYASKTIKKIIRDTKVTDIRLHDTRHTHATLLYPHIPVKDLSDRLGHSDTSFTSNTYTHVTKNTRQEVAEKISDILSKKSI